MRKTWSIDPRAQIDEDVEIGPFCVIGPHVRIGRGTRLENSVTLMGRVAIGQFNHIWPGTIIGGEPQDISYSGADTKVVIGDHNLIRECVTINRGTEKEEGITSIGDHNFLMACCHVAHDCRLGSHIIITNGTLLGGHVHVHDHATLSGGVGSPPLRHHRQLQLRGRDERRAARRRRPTCSARATPPGPAASTSWP